MNDAIFGWIFAVLAAVLFAGLFFVYKTKTFVGHFTRLGKFHAFSSVVILLSYPVLIGLCYLDVVKKCFGDYTGSPLFGYSVVWMIVLVPVSAVIGFLCSLQFYFVKKSKGGVAYGDR